MKREFLGIWIPKEIWCSTELSLQEKVFYVEIESLDNEQGCFASNSYFAKFFGLSKTRCSHIIKSLEDKGYIKVTFNMNDKEVTSRTIKINKKFTKIGGNFPQGGGNFPQGGGNFPQPYNNISNNKINNKEEILFSKENNTSSSLLVAPTEADKNGKITQSKFDEFWELYPRKVGKGDAKTAWEKLCTKNHGKDRPTWKEVRRAIILQKRSSQWQNPKFIRHPSVWLNKRSWMNDPGQMTGSWEEDQPVKKTGFVGKTEIKYKEPKIV